MCVPYRDTPKSESQYKLLIASNNCLASLLFTVMHCPK
jgi:hypothetical protein